MNNKIKNAWDNITPSPHAKTRMFARAKSRADTAPRHLTRVAAIASACVMLFAVTFTGLRFAGRNVIAPASKPTVLRAAFDPSPTPEPTAEPLVGVTRKAYNMLKNDAIPADLSALIAGAEHVAAMRMVSADRAANTVTFRGVRSLKFFIYDTITMHVPLTPTEESYNQSTALDMFQEGGLYLLPLNDGKDDKPFTWFGADVALFEADADGRVHSNSGLTAFNQFDGMTFEDFLAQIAITVWEQTPALASANPYLSADPTPTPEPTPTLDPATVGLPIERWRVSGEDLDLQTLTTKAAAIVAARVISTKGSVMTFTVQETLKGDVPQTLTIDAGVLVHLTEDGDKSYAPFREGGLVVLFLGADNDILWGLQTALFEADESGLIFSHSTAPDLSYYEAWHFDDFLYVLRHNVKLANAIENSTALRDVVREHNLVFVAAEGNILMHTTDETARNALYELYKPASCGTLCSYSVDLVQMKNGAATKLGVLSPYGGDRALDQNAVAAVAKTLGVDPDIFASINGIEIEDLDTVLGKPQPPQVFTIID